MSTHGSLAIAPRRSVYAMRPLRLIFAVFRKVKEEVMADRGLTVERMVRLAQVSRASYYRFEEGGKSGSDFDTELRDAIQRVALEWSSYGRRRLTQELRRRGWTVNPKR